MNKREEIQKQIVDTQHEINFIISNAIHLSPEEMAKLYELHTEMEKLQFALTNLEDGAK